MRGASSVKLREVVEFFLGSRLAVLRLFAVCRVVQSCERDVTHVTADIHCCLQARNQLCFFFCSCLTFKCLFVVGSQLGIQSNSGI